MMSSPSRPTLKTVSLTRAVVQEAAGSGSSPSHLDLKGRQITNIDKSAFGEQPHVSHIDLSNNKLTSIGPEFRPLKKLTRIDLRENLLRGPLTFMKYVPLLEETWMDGNPITLADRLVVLYFCPQLRLMDGKQVTKQRATLQNIVERVTSKLDSAWLNEKCDEQICKLNAAKTENAVKACMRRLKKDVPINENWTSAADVIMDDLIRQKVAAESERLRQSSQRKQGGPVEKDDGKSHKRPLALTEDSPNKKPHGAVVYEPKVFLRCHCHNNNPLDSSTQVWKAAFRKEENGQSERLVATCGGDLLCIIDCEQEKVIARYSDPEPHENFYALAWTSIPDENGVEEDVLAVAGNCRKIVIIRYFCNFTCCMFNVLFCRYTGLRCISKTPAHEKDINALLFHPSRRNLLFSGGYDKKIKLWDTRITEANADNVLQLLAEVDIHNRVLCMAFSDKFQTLFVGGEEGLTIWHDVGPDKEQGTFGQVKFGRSSNAIIDGLSILPDKPALLAVKQSRTGRIHISKICDMLSDLKKAAVRSRLNSFKEILFLNKTDLEYTATACDYFGLHAQPGLIACGDDAARICLYKTADISGDEETVRSMDDLLVWPEILNPRHGNKKVVDLTKPIVINSLTVSKDLKFIVAVTNINLVCVWHRTA